MKPHPFPLAEAFGVQVVLLWWATEHVEDDKASTCHCKTLKESTREKTLNKMCTIDGSENCRSLHLLNVCPYVVSTQYMHVKLLCFSVRRRNY